MNDNIILLNLKIKLNYDIYMISKKLHTNDFCENYINDYRRVRLKGIRSKCNELLKYI